MGMGGGHLGQPRTGNNNKVQFDKCLGRGQFGEVWKATYEGKTIAAKVTECPTGFPDNELKILKKAQGKFAVQLIAEEDKTPKGMCIVMKLCDGSLEDQVKAASRGSKRGPAGGMNAQAFLRAMQQIAEALEDLHRRGIIFGDLKPDNLLIDPDSRRIVFADFGDARLVSESTTRYTDPHACGWGNPSYHAKPDVMAMHLSVKSDMWMLAQTAAHLWTGSQPATNPVHLPKNIPMRAILEACLSQNEHNRPTAAQVLAEVRKLMSTQPTWQPSAPVNAPRPATTTTTSRPASHIPKAQPKPAARPASRPASRSSSRENSKPREASMEHRSPPRTFGQKIDSNVESPPPTSKFHVQDKKRSPLEEVAQIFAPRSPQPYGGVYKAPASDQGAKLV